MEEDDGGKVSKPAPRTVDSTLTHVLLRAADAGRHVAGRRGLGRQYTIDWGWLRRGTITTACPPTAAATHSLPNTSSTDDASGGGGRTAEHGGDVEVGQVDVASLIEEQIGGLDVTM